MPPPPQKASSKTAQRRNPSPRKTCPNFFSDLSANVTQQYFRTFHYYPSLSLGVICPYHVGSVYWLLHVKICIEGGM